MRILFLTHYFPPEVNAPASRTYEHCVRWVREGHEVTVVTCAPNCPDGVVFAGYRNRLRRQVETVDRIRVVRVWTYLAANAGTVKRIANYVSYMLSAVWCCLWMRRADVVVATSPQFFCGWAGVWVSRLKRVPFVLEIRDIWPESIVAVGALGNRRLLGFLEWLERRMYRAANHIVTVGNGYRERIQPKLTRDVPMSVIPNGVDLERFVPHEPDSEFLRQWNLEERFVCSYVGTVGMAHGLEVVIEAAKLLRARGRDDIRFLIVGDGARRAELEREVKEAGLSDHIVFTGRLPKEEMPRVIASSDACLIHLRGCELFGSVIPSKIFEIMAMQRPIIMGVKGEAQDLVMAAGAGVVMEPDSAESLVACLDELTSGADSAQRLGEAARDFVAGSYSREAFARDYLELLQSLAPATDPAAQQRTRTAESAVEPAHSS